MIVSSSPVRRGRAPSVVASTLALLVGLALLAAPTAGADQPGGYYAGVVPARTTPHVLDGKVLSIASVGNTMVLGGTFRTAAEPESSPDDGTAVSRSRLLAFDAASGRLSSSFLPEPNGAVNVVRPAGDGVSVFVGGSFSRIGGVVRRGLARVRLSDGAVLTGFRADAVRGDVRDLRVADGRLWVAGQLRDVQGRGSRSLVTLDADTGAFRSFMRLRVRGVPHGGTTSVAKIDVTPDGRKLVALGNFATVGGRSRPQLAVLRIDRARATVAPFRTSFYGRACEGYNSYVRDVDLAPDGSFFVVVTTGGYRGANDPCDSSARFETGAGGSAKPTWVNSTGGDTNWSVEVADAVVYIGGHFRWQNNPFGDNRPGPGAVVRTGLAALDPSNGLPMAWDPSRTRGVGVFDFLLDERGLWVASDTDRIGAYYRRARIALLPARVTSFPALRRPTLPATLWMTGAQAPTPASLTSRSLSGSGSVGPNSAPVGTGLRQAKDAFMLNGSLYTAGKGGSFTRRSFDGSTLGAASNVDAADQLKRLTSWHQDLARLGGMFFHHGRIYYTRVGRSRLYSRYFNPESGVVGASRQVASRNKSGIDFAKARTLMLIGSRLWWTTKNGTLRTVAWKDGPRTGSPKARTGDAVSGPGIDGRRWKASAVFAFQGAPG